MLTVKIQNLNGDTLFMGYVPEEAVVIEGGLTRPRTATISVPINDPLAKLMERPWDDPEHDIFQDIRDWANAPSNTASAVCDYDGCSLRLGHVAFPHDIPPEPER
jgi:hypothetical protein